MNWKNSGYFKLSYKKNGRASGSFSCSRWLWGFFYPKSPPFYHDRFAVQGHCNRGRFFACGRRTHRLFPPEPCFCVFLTRFCGLFEDRDTHSSRTLLAAKIRGSKTESDMGLRKRKYFSATCYTISGRIKLIRIYIQEFCGNCQIKKAGPLPVPPL